MFCLLRANGVIDHCVLVTLSELPGLDIVWSCTERKFYAVGEEGRVKREQWHEQQPGIFKQEKINRFSRRWPAVL
jgi:hypothetical protein